MTTATEASTTVRIAHTEADVRACFRVIAQLRPHLDEESFVEQGIASHIWRRVGPSMPWPASARRSRWRGAGTSTWTIS